MFHTLSALQKPALIIPLLSFILAACGNKAQQASTADPGSNKLPVDIIVAHQEALNQEVSLVGTIEPCREVAIVAELAQKITNVAFKDGSYVRQGEVLYTLNDAEISSRLKQVAAELKLAQLTKDRLGNLLKTETINQQEYDEALMRLNSLEAQQELLNAERNKTIIRAPFSGKMGITKLQTGAYVSSGTVLATLQDQSSIKISFSVPETYLPYVEQGSTIKFTTVLSDKEYTATIIATEPGLEAQGRSLLVQAVTSNDNGMLRAGLSVKVLFNTGEKGATGVQLPSEALVPGQKGYNAFVIKKGVAKTVPVTIGNRTETKVTITSGISTGDSVIVSNILRLGDGMPVAPVPVK